MTREDALAYKTKVYEQNVGLIGKYMSIKGMYEVKNGIEYTQYNKTVNPDKFSWE